MKRKLLHAKNILLVQLFIRILRIDHGFLTGLYAPFEWNKKESFWRALTSLSDSFNGPWLVASSSVGDLRNFMNTMGFIGFGFFRPVLYLGQTVVRGESTSKRN